MDRHRRRETERDAQFRAFVAARRPALVRLATLLSAGDAHLAEDLVQIALTRLYVAWPRVRADGPEPYARKILVNAMLDERRRPWRREVSSDALPERLPDATPAADAGAADTEQVRAALAQLAPGMRAAVVLRHWSGIDVEGTAALMGCSEGNVKSQTARGLDRLRALLAEEITTSGRA
jgi:RNA polymerase sigma-70 factor (sigma-E family)